MSDILLAELHDVTQSNMNRLSDVENKMRVSEKEAEEAKKENREAKEAFNKVKKKRLVSFLIRPTCISLITPLPSDVISSTKPSITSHGKLITSTRL